MKYIFRVYLRFFVLFTILLVFSIPVSAQVVPSDLIENCKQWKITYPTGEEDKTLYGEPNNDFFYVDNTEDAIVFGCSSKSQKDFRK